MQVNPIGVYQHNNYSRPTKIQQSRKEVPQTEPITPSFKGGNGAALGIVGGFLAGAAATALVIATGGLAGVVAVAGAGATTVAGGAACTHVGGLIGHAIEEHGKKD